jgi:D-glycero-alpha-D-manno-heptose 1-phosphate guanylyltransferase
LISEAIILAGGLGTRLRDTVPDLPKCMAPVAGRPFLFHVINQLRSQGISKFIFSLGYKHELIEAYLQDQFSTLAYDTVIEDEPLGTGGAIRLACTKTTTENVLITNGDTIFRVDITKMTAIHHEHAADATLALKPMQNFDRYGVVEMDENQQVIHFREKQFCKQGNINGGIYLLNTMSFLENNWPDKFSFEKEFLETGLYRLFGSVQDAFFIDIGIPEDYERAQRELRQPPLELSAIDNEWTLFIDRDGVINHEKKDDYIRNRGEFSFYDGVEQAFEQVGQRFGKVVIVSNQRGIGRKLMTEEDLADIHQNMLDLIRKAGGKVDAIYYCTAVEKEHPDRKPNPGMAFRAAAEIPGIDLSKSIMVGNKSSDMLFARNAGIYAVFVATTHPETTFPHPDIDLRFNSLPEFAKACIDSGR